MTLLNALLIALLGPLLLVPFALKRVPVRVKAKHNRRNL